MSARLGEMFDTRLLIAASEIIDDRNLRRVSKSGRNFVGEGKTQDARRGRTTADAFKSGNALLKTTCASS